jgi:hypothetical protein
MADRVPLLRLALAALLFCSTAAAAAPLTIRTGESWAFSVADGQPVKAHRVDASAKPARGEIKARVSAIAGTTMTLTNATGSAFAYRAELVGASGKATSRTCSLPATAQPVLEYWPQKAAAVRIGDFRAAKGAGSCPQNR